MKSVWLVALFAATTILTGETLAGEKTESAVSILSAPTPESQVRFRLQQNFESQAVRFTQDSAMQTRSSKSVGTGVLLSAILPGTGQFYAGSKLKGAIFLAVEAVALAAHFKYNSDGSKLEDQFEAFADQSWNEDAYWDWMSQISGIDRNNLEALRDFEHGRFSHFLPEKKNQQYYENVGKYNQFIMGWQDFREEIVGNRTFTLEHYDNSQFDGQSLLTISEQRNSYTQLRKDANDDCKRATTFATVALLNHVVSALDAGLTIKRRNQTIHAKLGVQGMRHYEEFLPALALGVSW